MGADRAAHGPVAVSIAATSAAFVMDDLEQKAAGVSAIRGDNNAVMAAIHTGPMRPLGWPPMMGIGQLGRTLAPAAGDCPAGTSALLRRATRCRAGPSPSRLSNDKFYISMKNIPRPSMPNFVREATNPAVR